MPKKVASRVPVAFEVPRARATLLVAAVLLATTLPLVPLQFFGATLVGELVSWSLRVGAALGAARVFIGVGRAGRLGTLVAHMLASLGAGVLGELLNYASAASHMTKEEVDWALMAGAWEDAPIYATIFLAMRLLFAGIATAGLAMGFERYAAPTEVSSRRSVEHQMARAALLLAPIAILGEAGLVAFAVVCRVSPVNFFGFFSPSTFVSLSALIVFGLVFRRVGARRAAERAAWLKAVQANEVEGASIEANASTGEAEVVVRIAEGAEGYRGERREVARVRVEDYSGETPEDVEVEGSSSVMRPKVPLR